MTQPSPEDWEMREAREAAEEAAILRRFKNLSEQPWDGTVCTLGAPSTARIGQGCIGCGHTTLVHPQPFANPALSECAICRMLKTIGEMKTQT